MSNKNQPVIRDFNVMTSTRTTGVKQVAKQEKAAKKEAARPLNLEPAMPRFRSF